MISKFTHLTTCHLYIRTTCSTILGVIYSKMIQVPLCRDNSLLYKLVLQEYIKSKYKISTKNEQYNLLEKYLNGNNIK